MMLKFASSMNAVGVEILLAVGNSAHRQGKCIEFSTASKISTPPMLMLLTNFNFILVLISASQLTPKLLSDFHYLFNHNCVFNSR